MPLSLRIHRKEQSMSAPQNQRLLLRLRRHSNINRSGEVDDNLRAGRVVQAVFLMRRAHDVVHFADICEVEIHGAGGGAVEGCGVEGGGNLPAFEGGGFVVGGVDDGGCGEVFLLLVVLARGSQDAGGEGEEGEEGEEAHFDCLVGWFVGTMYKWFVLVERLPGMCREGIFITSQSGSSEHPWDHHGPV